MMTVGPSVSTTVAKAKVQVVSTVPIADKIRNLNIITCDLCNTRKATYDVFINGVIKGIPILKRCCDNCIKSISPNLTSTNHTSTGNTTIKY
ncbi:MAG: hypothetical protein WBE34_20320 [Candidatus Nitrosopolaris sp.]